jgi:hypothetical protein
VSSRPLAGRLVHRREIEAAAQFDGDLEIVGANQRTKGRSRSITSCGSDQPLAVKLPDIQFDARQVLLDKRPLGAGLQQLHDPVAGAEPDFGLRSRRIACGYGSCRHVVSRWLGRLSIRARGSYEVGESFAQELEPLAADDRAQLCLHPVVIRQQQALQLDDLRLQLLRAWFVQFVRRVDLAQLPLPLIEPSLLKPHWRRSGATDSFSQRSIEFPYLRCHRSPLAG